MSDIIDRNRKLYLLKVDGWRYDVLSRNNPLDNGGLSLRLAYDRFAMPSDCFMCEYPLVSAWIDPAEGNKMFKAYAAVPEKINSDNDQLCHEVAEIARDQLGIEYTMGSASLILTADEYLNIVRFGHDNRWQYHSLVEDSGNSYHKERLPVYDTKADALRALLNEINNSTSTKLSGIDIINLGAASDEMMQGLGYAKIEDELGNGLPLWLGDPSKMLRRTIEASEQQNQGQLSFSSDWQERKKQREKALEGYLSLIESEFTDAT